MTDANTFLNRVVAARSAAWKVFLVAVSLQLLTYFAFLGMKDGLLDGLIEAGFYGDMTRDELKDFVIVYVAALKLMSTAVLLAALFLTWWVRGLRRLA
jgi:hypothetical protein